MTTPLRQFNLLLTYGTVFSIAAANQAVVACIVSFWFFGVDTAGSPIWVLVIAVVNAMLIGFLLALLPTRSLRPCSHLVGDGSPIAVGQHHCATNVDGALAAIDQQHDAGQLCIGGLAASKRTFRTGPHRSARHLIVMMVLALSSLFLAAATVKRSIA